MPSNRLFTASLYLQGAHNQRPPLAGTNMVHEVAACRGCNTQCGYPCVLALCPVWPCRPRSSPKPCQDHATGAASLCFTTHVPAISPKCHRPMASCWCKCATQCNHNTRHTPRSASPPATCRQQCPTHPPDLQAGLSYWARWALSCWPPAGRCLQTAAGHRPGVSMTAGHCHPLLLLLLA